MKKVLAILVAAGIALALTSAFAEINLSEMGVDDLVALRDKVNQEISNKASVIEPILIYETEDYKFTFSDFVAADKKIVNEYYDKCYPGTGLFDECNSLLLPFVFENKSEQMIEVPGYVNEVSVNGWVISGYLGMRDVPAGKKANGFLYLKLLDCEADTVDDVNSAEFGLFIEPNGDYASKSEIRFKIIRTDKGLILSN